jgi:CHAD domain-containing protein
MRSMLPNFRAAFPRAVTNPWAEEMKWAQRQLGTARDLDVLIHERLAGDLSDPGKKKLLELADKARGKAYVQVRKTLKSKRYSKLKRGLSKWNKSKAWNDELPRKRRKALKGNIVPFAVAALNKAERRVLKAGENITSRSDVELHRLRIQCKKLRYAGEFFTPLFDKQGMRAYIKRLKELQDMLGLMHDIAVIEEDILGPVKAGVKDRQIDKFVKAFAAEQRSHYGDTKKQLLQRWKEFKAADQPWK